MAVASLVFVVGFFFGLYGSWMDWVGCAFLYGMVLGFRRWVLWGCLVAGLAFGFWKVSQREEYVSGYTERTLVVMSHPVLSPDGVYMHRSGELVFFSSTPWFLGDTVAIRGKIRLTKTGASLYPSEIVLVKRRDVLASFSRIFFFWQERIERHISPSSFRSLVFALVLGNRLFLDYGTKREFQLSGLFHLLAISGLHLALIAGALQGLLGCFLSQKRAWVLSTLLLSLYTLVVGAPASLVRATLFLWGYVLLWDVRTPLFWLDWVFFVAGLCCVFLPLSWLGTGFSLSFLAVVGILLVAEPLSLLFQKFWPFGGLAGVTLSANVMTFPLLSMTFGEMTILSFVANLVIVPLFPFVLGGCFVAAIWAIFGSVASWFLVFLEKVWGMMATLIHFFSLGGSFSLSFSPRLVGWWYGFLGALLLFRMLGFQKVWERDTSSQKAQLGG